MVEAGRMADLGAYFRNHYLVLNEGAREVWERGLAFLRGAAFDEAFQVFMLSGGVAGLRKDETPRLLASEQAGRGGLLLLLDVEAKVLHRVLSWTYVRQGLKANKYEDASVISLDTPKPMALAPRIDSLFGEKAEVLYPLRDGGHAFLDVTWEGITLIVEGKPIRVGREGAKAFVAKVLKGRARRRSWVEACVCGLMGLVFYAYLLRDSMSFSSILLQGVHALLVVIGAHMILKVFMPTFFVAWRLLYERFFTQRQDEVACYGKWSAPWLSLFLTVVCFVLLVGVLLVFVFLPLKK